VFTVRRIFVTNIVVFFKAELACKYLKKKYSGARRPNEIKHKAVYNCHQITVYKKR
jgi:hypothetical protein